ncbi:MAG TPA: integrase arm-type DNA-binding domain-containing protein [Novimethylophilus sp.]|uniref:tyrosine-type recombinase/integrase n=1 Tax=Novimethylophilus sp. TaxID=2137426 RepID=UPI002F3FCFE4
MMALTDVEIRQAKPQEKAYKLFDGGGLYVEVMPTGGKLWRYKYRFGGKEKRLALGAYPEITLKDARERHLQARKLLADDIDPGENRKAEKQEKAFSKTNTFREWAGRWHQHWQQGKSERHARQALRRMELDLYPELGDMPITAINAPDVVRTVKAIAKRGALDLAKRGHQMIGQVFRYAIAHGDESKVIRNPAADIKPSDIIETRRKKNYARVEIKELPALLRAIEAASINQVTRIAIKLMALTFIRTSELIGGKWDEIDLDAAEWRIPADRMKMDTPHIVPLSSQAVELLKTLQLISGSSEYLFPAQHYGRKSATMSNNTILVALRRMGYGGMMTGHGFRGIASTALHEQGFDHQHIELQLAHAERNEVSAAYNHALYLKQRTAMMQHWADYLDGLRAGAKVIPIHGKAA